LSALVEGHVRSAISLSRAVTCSPKSPGESDGGTVEGEAGFAGGQGWSRADLALYGVAVGAAYSIGRAHGSN